MELLVVQRGEDAAGAVVAVDGVAADAAADDLRAFKHHAAEQAGAFRAVALFNHIDVAAVRVDQLAAVAAAGAETDARRFQHHHVIAGFHQKQRGGEAGIAAADHADVALDRFIQLRIGLMCVGRGRIVAFYVFSHEINPYSSEIRVVFNSVNLSSACSDLSRPLPLCL